MTTRSWWRRGGAAAVVALALAAACGGDDSPDTAGGPADADGASAEGGVDGATEGGGWSFTDDRGETVTLDEPPDVIVAQTAAAGGLWEYEVDVAGVFGPLRRSDGTPDPGIGLADPEDFTSVGEAQGQPNLEAVAALRPDIIVTSLWGDTYWGIDEALVDEMAQIAPIVAFRVEERSMAEPLARVADLAEALGAEVEAGPAAEARDAFDAASDRLEAALADKPGLTVLAASGTPSEMYVAWPDGFPDLVYFQELGMDLVSPEEHPVAEGYWEALSWERADTYPADVILADVRDASIDNLLDQVPSTVRSLPAVEADQMLAWPATYAMGYGHVAGIVDDLAAAIEAASDVV